MPEEETEAGMVESAVWRRDSEEEDEEGCEEMSDCRARSSALKGRPEATACSTALTAVKSLRARTPSLIVCRIGAMGQ